MPLKKEQLREIEDEQPVTNADERPPARIPRIWDLQPMPDYDPGEAAIVNDFQIKDFIEQQVSDLAKAVVKVSDKGYILTRHGWREVETKPITIAAEPPQRSVHVMGMGSGRQEGKKVKRYKLWSKR